LGYADKAQRVILFYKWVLSIYIKLETKSKFSNLAAMNYETTMDGLTEDQLEEFIIKGLDEDVQDGDHTSLACV